MEDELVSSVEFTEKELTLYYLTNMIDSIIEQLFWLKTIVEGQIEELEDE